ncbi:MAG: response regulator [Phycisphaerales bacterium]|nr:response regulator [Phycisphaerales bacterium]
MEFKQHTAKNTLRIGARELDELVDRIDAISEGRCSPNREFVRWSFRMVSVDLCIENIGGNKVTIPVVTRNISRGGISALHSSYVYPKSRCSIRFTLPDGRDVEVRGEVVRCVHLSGKVHEIGVKFDEQVSTRDLLGLDPMEEAYSLERVMPEQLIGTVLIVTSSELDREMLLCFLQQTQLTIRVASNIEEAIERARKGCDLIFADLCLGDECGVELVAGCREAGIDVPILVMTTDDTDATRDDMRMAGASGYFSKPIDRHRLYQALAEFMLADGDGGPVYTTLEATDPAYELLGNFFANMPKTVVGLENGLRDGDRDACLRICRTLAGIATPLGFEGLGELAIKADRALTRGSAVRDAASDIRSLIIACRRVRVRSAA